MSVQEYDSQNKILKLIAGGTLWADCPIGTINAYGGATAPDGWMLCQGQAISRTDYADLFAVIGTAFGSGDGSTTFNVPDMRESVPVGVNQSSNSAIAAHDVYTLGQFKDDQLQNIEGQISVVGSSAGTTSGAFDLETYTGADIATSGGGYYKASPLFNASRVARTGTSTHGKQLGVNFIIKAKQVALPADLEEAIQNIDFLTWGNNS